MDYDGSNQRQTHTSGIHFSSPRISPDGSRLAFSSMTKSGWDILMYSTELNRVVSFPRFGGTNLAPSWSPDGTKLALASRAAATLKSTNAMPAAATFIAMTRERPGRLSYLNRKTGAQSLSSVAALGCPRSTPWRPMALTSSA